MADITSVEGGPSGSPPPSETSPTGSGTTAGKGKWLVLVAMVFGLFMPMLDNLVVNVALPTMQRELDARVSDLQWIIDAYTLTFASFMLIGGSLGDLFGRKKFFLGGLVLFTLGSLACGMSESTEQLIAFRAVQGLGAALLLPGSLSILTATFHGKERGTAIGIWAAMSGLAVAAGPLVGGYIVEHYSWETIFFINIPVGIVGFLLTAIVVRESRDTTRARRVDVPGLLTGTGGLFLLVYALIEGGVEGWTSDLILSAFAGSAVLLIAFIVIEIKSRNPMLPLHFFRNPTFAASNVVAAAVFFALFGTTFFLALYLQNVRGFSPLETGVRLLPFTAMILLISPIAGKLSDKHGSRWLMTLGCLYAAGGMALLLRIEPNSSYESIILPAFVVLGSGMAMTMAPMTAAVMGSVDPRHAGVASAATNTTRELGGVLGIALLGALVTSSFRDRLLENLISAGIDDAGAQSIVEQASGNAAAGGGTLEAFRQQVPEGTPETVIAQVVSAAQNSFVEAIHSGMAVAVGFMLLAALVAAIFVRSHVKDEPAEEVPVDEKEEDDVRKGKKIADLKAQPQIDPRTEEILRQALEPAASTTMPEPEPEPDLMPTAEWAADETLKPARPHRFERRRTAPTPVSVADTHYHEEPAEVASGNGWAPEPEEAGQPAGEATRDWAESGADSYNRLRMLMVDLPMKAGTGEVEHNLQEVALATLIYYEYGLSQPDGDALPVGVTNGAQSSTKEDISILAGYLDLEKRFGRVDTTLATDEAASKLMAALAGRALQLGGASSHGNAEYVQETIAACLQGQGRPQARTQTQAVSGAEEGGRFVYRRSRKTPGSGE
ncbi:MAG TPA: MFS transporter [Actinomycetota bacterium]|nr:MFS transporter [Actinomycetota bacterium]